MVTLVVWLLVAMATYAYGQNKPIACPGVKLIRLNCFKSANPKASMPNLIFTKKVNYRQWNDHLKSVVCQCVAKRGKSNVVGIRNVGECRTGNLYAKEGTAPLKDCNTWNATPCKSKADCVGNGNTVFVYRVEPITTPKPAVTTKPTKPNTKGKKVVSKKPAKTSPENLMCKFY
ncbi:uncharacterized protein LOC116308508 [Actinia tenebrosa]|uniref:Uncharacterized protein LOC116308508 n=1 Tax=Actinia tenebrosa TaxID=6105 RepID=A0A6P8JEH2_ACTTE|nr:uncharacterized protein LOC116308508 [Actinia tenebrosa]